MLFHLRGEETAVRIPAQGCICLNNIYCVRGELQLPQAKRIYHRLPQVALTELSLHVIEKEVRYLCLFHLEPALPPPLGEKEQ